MSKQAVKRTGKAGKRHGENFVSYMARREDESGHYANSVGKTTEQDMFLIALKRMGLLGPKRIKQLDETLRQVRRDYSILCAEDVQSDKDIIYTKAKVDEELRGAIGEEWFQDWDTRYNMVFYSDGLRCIDITNYLARVRQNIEEAVENEQAGN